MTLTLELPAELEEQLQTQAQQLGVAADDIALDAMVFYLAALNTLNQRTGRLKRITYSEPLLLPTPISAPTGKGKTQAALLAALDAIGSYDTRTGLPPIDNTNRSAEPDIYGYSEREDAQL